MRDNRLNVYGVAHDLNNQITILLNCLDRVTIVFPEDTDCRKAITAAERCAELTAQLLPQTRARRAIPLISVAETLAEAQAMMAVTLPPRHRLEVACNTSGQIAADPADIQSVLFNLFLNALDAMDKPGRVRIVAESDDAWVCISISDSGPGVPLSLRERIFEPLFTSKADKGGKGLGLARVRDVVTRLGGTIVVEDAASSGAEFRIKLPIAESTGSHNGPTSHC